MPAPSPANQSPSLRCLCCKQPFRITLDRIGMLHKCKHCDCRFRVIQEQTTGQYEVREERAAVRPTTPAPKPAAPRTSSRTNPHEVSPTTSFPGAAPANTDADRTMMGKPTASAPLPSWMIGEGVAGAMPGNLTAPPTKRPGEPVAGDADGTIMGKPTAPPPLRPGQPVPGDADCTMLGKPAAPPTLRPAKPVAGDADGTMMGKLTAPPPLRPGQPVLGDADGTMLGKQVAPPNGRPRRPAPAPPQTVKAPAPSHRGPSQAPRPPAPTQGASVGRWIWVVALAGVFVLVLGGLAAYFLLLGGKTAPASLVSLGKYGGIEIGSTGVKRVGVEYYKSDKGIVESLLDEPKDVNPKIADLPDGADHFDERTVQKTVDQVGDYYEALQKLGVPADNILVVCSSGVLAPFKTDETLQRNRDRLVKALRLKLPSLSKDPEFIDAHDEAKFSFQETVKASEWDDSVLIDVGGNNIKGGGFVRKDNFLDFSVQVGASSFEKKVTKEIKDKNTGESFLEAALRLRPAELETPLHADLSAVDQLTTRKKVHLIGGVPWAMATYTEPDQLYAARDAAGAASNHGKLAAADIARFDEMVRTLKPQEIKKIVEGKVADKGKETAEAVDENVDKIQTEVFKNQDRLVGGAQILLALDKEFSMRAENKEVWTFRYGQVAWLLGYVKSRSGRLE